MYDDLYGIDIEDVWDDELNE